MSILEKLKTNTNEWLEDRLKLSALHKMMSKKVVPQHEHSIVYYFGGMAMFFFILQIITGLLLMVYYQPGVETSYESVKYIIEKVAFGELIRSIHSWSANLMIAVVFIHMFTVYFTKSYRKPRELTWLTGFGLLMLAFGLGFSGYLLTWDELAFFATKVGLQIMEQSPIVGPIMADLLRGGADLSNATIGRFFELHVIVLPLAIMGLLGAHLLLVQLHGMHTPHSYTNKPEKLRKSIPFFTDFLYRDLFIWTLLFAGVVLLAYVSPWGIGPKADPWAPAPEGIKPEWYFIFMFQILKMIPAHVGPFEGEVFGIVMFGIAGAIFALVPFWEGINKITSKLATTYGIIAVTVILVTTIPVYLPKQDKAIAAASGGTAVASGAGGAEIFKQSCAACHSIGGGKLVGPDLKGVSARWPDKDQLANFIVDPAGSQMPKIEGIDKATALTLLEYIDAESNPSAKKQEAQAEPAKEVPFTQDDVENGRQIFLGTKPFANGGTACIACHSVSSVEAFGGGTLGPDLTGAYTRLGERKGFEAWLSSIPSATMKPIYEKHQLQPEEIHALTAYFSSVETEKKSPEKVAATADAKPPLSKNAFFIVGFTGMVMAMAIIAALYQNRFRGVRGPLVHGQKNDDKESNG